MAGYAVPFLIGLVVFLALDSAWLLTVGKWYYVRELGALLKSPPNYAAALVFYVVFVLGLVHFVIVPGYGDGRIGRAALQGAAFGLVAYATYDLTNYATLRGFPLHVAIVDMFWGAALAAAVTAITLKALQLFQA